MGPRRLIVVKKLPVTPVQPGGRVTAVVPHGGALQTVVTTHGHETNLMGWDQQFKKTTVDRNVCVCVFMHWVVI